MICDELQLCKDITESISNACLGINVKNRINHSKYLLRGRKNEDLYQGYTDETHDYNHSFT